MQIHSKDMCSWSETEATANFDLFSHSFPFRKKSIWFKVLKQGVTKISISLFAAPSYLAPCDPECFAVAELHEKGLCNGLSSSSTVALCSS